MNLSVPQPQALVQAATLAPSSHNTQPWLFRLEGTVIELMADRTRALPVNDPDDRELTISCGCALFNLRVAAAAAGLHAQVEPWPDAADSDLLARVQLHAHLSPTGAQQADAALQAAMSERRTYRERFAATAVDPMALRSLVDAVQAEAATLAVLDTADQRLGAAALVAEGDAMQWANPSWRRELAAWMHPRRRGDGLTLPALAIPVAQMVVRTFDMGHGVAAKDRQLADESPVLAVLFTAGDRPSDWLAAGQALQRLLLTGVPLGLQASYLNQPVQVAALRPKLQQLTGRPGYAQLLLRIGTPMKAVPAGPRRPLADVLAASGNVKGP
jgi:nitroreductase